MQRRRYSELRKITYRIAFIIIPRHIPHFKISTCQNPALLSLSAVFQQYNFPDFIAKLFFLILLHFFQQRPLTLWIFCTFAA